MADESNTENGLPPKLDLRRMGGAPLDGTTNAAPADATTPQTRPTVIGRPPLTAETMRMRIPEPAPSAAPKTPVLQPLRAAEDVKPELPVLPPDVLSEATPAPVDSVTPPAPGAPRPVIRPMMAPKTIKLRKPVPLGIKREATDPDADPGTKRATSKISLPSEFASPETATPANTRTIHIEIAPSSPASASPLADPGTQVDSAPGGGVSLPLQPAPDPKRQTSRISLESVLGNDASTGPKTIKLKRPGSLGSVRVQGAGAPDSEDVSQNTPATDQTEGAKSEAPETQKMTIKVKRPSARPSIRTSGTGGSGAGDTPTMFAPPVSAAPPADTAHWTFIFSACAATIITCVLIYVLCAQVMGPNISLTELAYFAPDTELPWPERIYR